MGFVRRARAHGRTNWRAPRRSPVGGFPVSMRPAETRRTQPDGDRSGLGPDPHPRVVETVCAVSPEANISSTSSRGALGILRRAWQRRIDDVQRRPRPARAPRGPEPRRRGGNSAGQASWFLAAPAIPLSAKRARRDGGLSSAAAWPTARPLRDPRPARRGRHGPRLPRPRSQPGPRGGDQGAGRRLPRRRGAACGASSARPACSPTLSHPNIAGDLRLRGPRRRPVPGARARRRRHPGAATAARRRCPCGEALAVARQIAAAASTRPTPRASSTAT